MFKKKYPTPVPPRTVEEISNDFSQLQFTLGQHRYLIDLHSKNADKIIERMNKLDEEATARKNLDAEVAKAKKPKKDAVLVEEKA